MFSSSVKNTKKLPKCDTVGKIRKIFLPIQFTGLDIRKLCANQRPKITSTPSLKMPFIFSNFLGDSFHFSLIIFHTNFTYLASQYSQLRS